MFQCVMDNPHFAIVFVAGGISGFGVLGISLLLLGPDWWR